MLIELNESEISTIEGISKEHDETIDVKKEYYDSGVLKSETPYVNGEIHGIRKIYYESGALTWEIPYVNGIRHGVEKTYYQSGDLLNTAKYKNDKKVGK